MKPWEETWSHDEDNLGDVRYSTNGKIAEFWWDIKREDMAPGGERAKLAAQAPAMARMLLRAIRMPAGDEWGCLGCGTWEEGNHTPECELVALLRTAGVLPAKQ